MQWLVRVVCTVVLLATLSGCKATVEGESKRWQTKVEQLNSHAAAHPNFQAPIEAHIAAAAVQYEGARDRGNDEEVAKAMAEANRTLDELLQLFESIDSRKQEVARLQRDHDLMSLSARIVTPLIREADDAVFAVNETLRTATPPTAARAKISLKTALDRLEAATRNLRRLRDQARRDRERQERSQAGTPRSSF